jgi:hypothetical protein
MLILVFDNWYNREPVLSIFCHYSVSTEDNLNFIYTSISQSEVFLILVSLSKSYTHLCFPSGIHTPAHSSLQHFVTITAGPVWDSLTTQLLLTSDSHSFWKNKIKFFFYKESKIFSLCIGLSLKYVQFRRFYKITKSDYQLRCVCPSFCLSACPHRTTRLPWDRF